MRGRSPRLCGELARSRKIATLMSRMNSQQRNVRAIIFDMDGLMIDSESIYWAVGRRIAKSFGKEVSNETLGRMMGRSPLDSVQLFVRELQLDVDPAALLAQREEEVFQLLKQGVTPMPGLGEVLDQFRSRYTLAIATSARREIVNVILAGLDIEDRFTVLQTSDDVVHGKPGPEIYLKAMSKLAVDPSESVVLEDSSNGALAGKRAGALVIAVPSTYTKDQDFSFVDFRAGDLFEAAELIARVDRSRQAS